MQRLQTEQIYNMHYIKALKIILTLEFIVNDFDIEIYLK